MAPASLSIFLTALTLLRQPLIITAAVVPPIVPILSSVNATTISSAAAAADNNLQCIDSTDWVTTAFIAGDCYTAIALFEDYEVYRHSTTLFEFYASTIHPPQPQQFAQSTPRKYTYRSCTLAVAMIADLPPDLPGLPARRTPWPRTDICDYVSIENAALNVRDGCLSVVGGVMGGGGGMEIKGEEGGGGEEGEEGKGGKGKGEGRGRVGFVNPAGYDTAGMNQAIGVFLWDTNSVLNQVVKERVGVGNVTGG